MGEEPGRRRRRVRPSHPAPSAATPPPDQATDEAGTAVTPPPPRQDAAEAGAAVIPPVEPFVAETSPVLDPEEAPKPTAIRPGPATVPTKPAATMPTKPAAATVPPRPAATAPPRPGSAPPGARPAASANPGARPSAATARPSGPGSRAPGARGGGEEPGERGLRGLVGSGSSQVSVTAALRARDAARPSEQQLADAERDLTIVRRNWVPREDLPRGR
ncbi:hypothetical protein CLV70_12638 [Pseudosporangium ferrugineum]|uniref:Uncharacterized protein n=2 Tax=Pseudosporangium ferrugineum TaxID=439699 RepID=A0A2T0RFW5_9ACTN|nr:hypothetical protein CLV70_12638 [Pseudosporangium ferrugineum]